MRWLCIDPGHKRLGLALGDTRDGIASPLTTVAAEPEEQALEEITHLAGEYRAVAYVVGWPLNMDDSEGPQAREAREFACRLRQRSGGDVRLWDERLSSFEADQALAGHLTRKKRRRRQDAIAAAVILQDFFFRGGPDSAPRCDEISAG